jgi:hypothetical protein
MVKRKRTKDRPYNGQKKKDEGQTMQWSKEKGRRTDNTRVRPFSFDPCIVSPSSFFF